MTDQEVQLLLADPAIVILAAAGRFSWPPAGSNLAVSGQFLVAAVTRAARDLQCSPVVCRLPWEDTGAK